MEAFFLFSVLGDQRITWQWRSMYTFLATANIGSRTYIYPPVMSNMTKDAMADAWRTRILCRDSQHGWIHSEQVKAPPKSAILRLFRPIQLAFHEILPRVKAANCLIIRRQLRHCISPSVLCVLLSRFDRLEHISYEP
jgi:hypothetical protein